MTRFILASETCSEHRQAKETPRSRSEHLRRIHKMTHEQQIALVEEARAARQAEQAHRWSRSLTSAIPTSATGRVLRSCCSEVRTKRSCPPSVPTVSGTSRLNCG
jgi:hypothetical protein